MGSNPGRRFLAARGPYDLSDVQGWGVGSFGDLYHTYKSPKQFL